MSSGSAVAELRVAAVEYQRVEKLEIQRPFHRLDNPFRYFQRNVLHHHPLHGQMDGLSPTSGYMALCPLLNSLHGTSLLLSSLQ
ncbi:hypothetical protein HID58_020963 [Brassica napus]|uniref:Uncharacterized protein n=1 Tax=Brassica napus TaxID=3708 RepID=A0ABQ8CV23_BRANA|nr:hypothetical protein HID58_020963 [Brassica napus]